jgi:hypothetical protein
MPWTPAVKRHIYLYRDSDDYYYCVGVDENNPCKHGSIVLEDFSTGCSPYLPTCSACFLRRAKLELTVTVLLCLNRRALNTGAAPLATSAHAHFNGHGQDSWKQILSYL